MLYLLLLLLILSIVFFLIKKFIITIKSFLTLRKDYLPIKALKSKIELLTSRYIALEEDNAVKKKKILKYNRLHDAYYINSFSNSEKAYKLLYKSLTIEALENQLTEIKDDIKIMIKQKAAFYTNLPDNLVFDNSRKQGRQFIDRQAKLLIRIFDHEIKVAISIVETNNINHLIYRLNEKFSQINDDNKLVQVFLNEDYFNLKILQLRAYYELREKKRAHKEKEREILKQARFLEREEKRLKKETEQAKIDEDRMKRLVEKELQRFSHLTIAQRKLLELHKQELEILQERSKRALSMAQQTKAGFVYVISNNKSFTSKMCKIGMTRRLDPSDRVKELGDASVPELFDTHFFIYAENAPDLENYLHKEFDKYRINLINSRREFFQVRPRDVLISLSSYSGSFQLKKAF